jgi:putative endonuclease
VTSELGRRAGENREGLVDGFAKRYGVHCLVYAEFHDVMLDAIAREKQIKRWRRAWKLELIERDNPQWRDLYDEFLP